MTVEATPMEVFDGVILSDGCLQMRGDNARLIIQLSGAVYLDWLRLIERCLAGIGVSANKEHPKVIPAISHSKPYDRALLTFNTHPFFTQMYNIWYKDNIKILPSSLQLTPGSVSHFYMGDGCASYRHPKSAPNSVFVSAVFCTDSFTEAEVDTLVSQLRALGITRAIKQKAKKHHEIYVSEANSVCTLMDMVEPHIVPSLSYKIKRPTLSQKRIRR